MKKGEARVKTCQYKIVTQDGVYIAEDYGRESGGWIWARNVFYQGKTFSNGNWHAGRWRYYSDVVTFNKDDVKRIIKL